MAHRHLQRQHAQNIFAVLADKKPTASSEIASQILTSWRRCADTVELDPMNIHRPAVVDATALRELCQRFEGFLLLAEPEMLNLYSSLKGSGYALILTNNDGVILNHLTGDHLEQDFREAGLWQGANWGESHAGTNGIGTCIAEGRPLTVHKDEHFLSQNIDLTCSAAPIHDPHGNLLAVLDASCCSNEDSMSAQVLARALVANSATIIENQFFLHEMRNLRILRFHQQANHLGLASEGLLAIDDQNRVRAINKSALKILRINDRYNMLDQEIDLILGKELKSMLLHAAAGDNQVCSFRDQRNGNQLYGHLFKFKEKPRRRNRDLSIPPAERNPDECRGELCKLSVLAGEDPRMKEAARRAERVMNKRIPILLHGETGTGKELFTQAIHLASERREKPFVALNCASIPETLIESELFGYRQGAFTGARRDGRRGKFIESDGGTLFLDEIGDMPLAMQSRLLRVLETQEVVPLGGDLPVKVDLHVVTATHRDLRTQVSRGEFREDLYYRLNGITLDLPPLREREDLSKIILKVLAAENDTGSELKISKESMDALLNYQWPGNLRQLRFVIRTAIALCDGVELQLDDFNLDYVSPPPAEKEEVKALELSLRESVDEQVEDESEDNPLQSAEQQVIVASLGEHNWNISKTAEALGMSRNTLYRKLRKHGINQTR
ncbi:MAG: sigma-54-dependent Fis family transcriptional regulator [Candidatus Thiodiazotropha taylori]|uniref:Sigma-54-dependent Fis family transcriptional regulator n=1 Tax=Candidatus Thiodiazotropha taylori TaxID=2792791 RepID=A0A9E4N5H2_9GAMM|nr:sigma-54-dependent Fis family transcriptional regulator [Candidatus Thiodiazotropha taylori]MCG8042861.1 sigma-54-dependent Fis family transcriptional regulator [Candidatus Thiodiazotropha taylori]MCG8050908.1 sigma-54-dependent Fis family transcriptional regulator [Candidatus Thiodiazotropha taylori]MCW4257985.1 sigma-54-dependent Fis family transcriptional regulator [Candidatus Thiodiazotropha taylori]MCW4312727.1 sigma-54-dependent Fis family transcriptional regulator [Candidatus Thiodiaz